MDHHITPKFLLRPWAERDPEKKLHAFLYRDGRLSRLRPTPASTSYLPDLYAFSREDVAGNSRQSVETKILQRVDGVAAKVRAKLCRSEVLSRADAIAWTRFLISLRARQPQVVDTLRNAAPNAFRRSLASHPEEFEAVANGSAPSLEAWTEAALPGLIDNFGLFIFGNITSYQPIADKIVRLKWATRHFPGSAHRLLLSDNPEFVGGKIDDPDFVITLPVAPDRVFLAVRDEVALEKISRTPDQYLIAKLNEQAVRLASEKVYATSWHPEQFIRNRLSSFGEINAILMPETLRSAGD